jgi:ethanolamine utilization protein EutN
MFLAKVTGSVVSTQKLSSMTGQKLLIVEPLRVDPKNRTELTSTQRSFVAVDTVGAGAGQMVLIVQGSSARMAPELEKLPIDTAIVGIVDEVSVEGKSVFKACDN